MKIGAMTQEFIRITPTIEETVLKLAEIGVDGVELEVGTRRLAIWDIKRAKRIKEICASKGLAISNLSPAPDFVFPSDWHIQKELHVIRSCCEMAVSLDVPCVRVQILSLLTWGAFPQIVGQSPLPVSRQYSQGVNVLTEAVKMAEDFGVTLGLDNDRFLTVMDHLRIVTEIDSPNLKLFMDARNALNNGEDPIATAQACGKLLVHSHVKDGIWMGGECAGRFLGGVPIGEGNVIDWEAYLKVLKEIGFTGFLSIEGAHVLPMYDPYDVTARGKKYLRMLNKKVGL